MAPSPEPVRHSFTLRIDLAEVSRARRLIAELADEAGFAEERRFDIQVASSEACANAIEHSPAEAEVELEVLTYLDRLEVRVEGSGQFELPAIAARGRMSRGLGLPLMAKLSDHLALYSGPRGGTLVALTFYRPGFRDEHPDDVTPPSIVELLEENELVTAILGSIADEVWFADAQRRFTLANAAAFAEFGAASSEGTGVEELATATEVYRADMTPRPLEEAPPLRALAGEVVKNQEEVVRTPASAGLRHRLVNAAPVRDASGEIVGAVSVVRDITEHRKAEEALTESEKLYRSLFASMKEAFFVGDVITDGAGTAVDYRIVEANSAMEAQTGVPLEHYIGNTALTMYPDLDAFWVDTYGRVGLTGEPARFDNYVPQQNRHYEVVAYQVRPGRFAAVFTDVTERRAAEHEIRDLSRRLTHHIEHSPLAVIEWGPDMRLVRWSGEAERMFGWQADEVLGKLMEDFRWVYQGDEAQVAEVSTELQDGTNPRRFSVNRNYRKDGSVIDCEWYNSSLLDEAGRLQSILSLVVDVSARKRAEEALRKSERSLAEAQHIGRIGSWEWNIQTGEVNCSGELYAIYQVNPDTFVPSIQAFGDYIHPDDRGLVDGIIRQILSGSAPGSFDFRIVPADGSIRHLSTTCQITEYGEAGRPRLMVGVNQDVTERKLAERERERLLAQERALVEELAASNEGLRSQTEELAAREEELQAQNEELLSGQYNRSLIEAALDPLVTIGTDGTITDVNEATVKITGYSREDLIGTDFSEYFTDPENARLGYQEAFARGSATDYPLTVRARDGKLTDVLYNASVYKDQQGNVRGVFAAARDLSAVRELEAQRAIASTLQEALLDIPEETSLLRFSHLYRSATRAASVGGDFYDVFAVKNDRVAVLIGDVSGHGVEAARVAILVKDVVHAFAHQFSRPEMVLAKTNELLLEKRTPGFVTVFLGVLDPDTKVLKYSSAGHPPALLRNGKGEVEELEAGSVPVGIFPGQSWKQDQVQLEKDDLLLLYTDGLIEARRNGCFFGHEGLVKSLARWTDPSLEQVPKALLDEVLSFSGGELSDDVAMLAVSLIPDSGGGRGKEGRRRGAAPG